MPALPLISSSLVRFHFPPSGPKVKGTEAVQPAQTTHRINLIEAWGGKQEFEKSSVLEIGCGQGDMTVVLVAAVSSDEDGGSVVGWDPASGDYGSPITLGEAQAIIKNHPEMNGYLNFSLTTPLSAVLTPSHRYSHVVFAHCMYYFPSPSILLDTFRALYAQQPPIQKICLAEHGLQISQPAQLPHLLAVLAESAFESLRKNPEEDGLGQSNVTTVMSSQKFLEVAKEAGWVLDFEKFITPDEELQDGGWEVGSVCSEGWTKKMDMVVGEGAEREKAWVGAMADATKNAFSSVKASGQKIRTMDTWCAVLKRGEL